MSNEELFLTIHKNVCFIQRNMCSLNANREEHNTLLSDFNQDVVCLQQTQVKADTNILFKHYSICHLSDVTGMGTRWCCCICKIFNTTSANYAPHQLASSIRAVLFMTK